MITIRPSHERGHANHGWLDTFHTFSFANYFDPKHVEFRKLRVLNEDRVAPGQGFGAHPHRNMEIITYVLEGALAHQDSTGGKGVLRPGEVQRMSAGTGVVHSEFNASDVEPVHFLQIWIHPAAPAIPPGYEQKAFPLEERRGKLRVLVSPDAKEGSLRIHADATLYGTVLAAGETIRHPLAEGRHAWVQVARGGVSLNGHKLRAGDGAALSQEAAVDLVAEEPSELLLFDLA